VSDVEARADRVRAIADIGGGNVLNRVGTTMTVDVRADMAPGLMVLWGEGG
jgi:hypothetical protein